MASFGSMLRKQCHTSRGKRVPFKCDHNYDSFTGEILWKCAPLSLQAVLSCQGTYELDRLGNASLQAVKRHVPDKHMLGCPFRGQEPNTLRISCLNSSMSGDDDAPQSLETVLSSVQGVSNNFSGADEVSFMQTCHGKNRSMAVSCRTSHTS